MSEATSTRFIEHLPTAWECRGAAGESVVPENVFCSYRWKKGHMAEFYI